MHAELPLRQPPGFGERLVDVAGHLVPPLLLHAAALLLQLLAQRLQLPRGALAPLSGLRTPAFLRRARRLPHLLGRLLRPGADRLVLGERF